MSDDPTDCAHRHGPGRIDAADARPAGDMYAVALTRFRYVANGLWSTDEAVLRIQGAA